MRVQVRIGCNASALDVPHAPAQIGDVIEPAGIWLVIGYPLI
jgi:hypothetical protein